MPRKIHGGGAGKTVPVVPLRTIQSMFNRCRERECKDPLGLVETPCMIFQGYLDGDGYAEVKFEGRKYRAARVMWTAFNGPIGDGPDIDHECRNRACLNPLHLKRVDPFTNQILLRDERKRRTKELEDGIPI